MPWGRGGRVRGSFAAESRRCFWRGRGRAKVGLWPTQRRCLGVLVDPRKDRIRADASGGVMDGYGLRRGRVVRSAFTVGLQPHRRSVAGVSYPVRVGVRPVWESDLTRVLTGLRGRPGPGGRRVGTSFGAASCTPSGAESGRSFSAMSWTRASRQLCRVGTSFAASRGDTGSDPWGPAA